MLLCQRPDCDLSLSLLVFEIMLMFIEDHIYELCCPEKARKINLFVNLHTEIIGHPPSCAHWQSQIHMGG